MRWERKACDACSYLQNSYVQVIDNHIKLSTDDHVHYVAKLVTLYDFYVQVTIGALLLVCRRNTDIAAHLLLLFFIFTTYIPAPVFGFGVTLSVLGFALAKERFQLISAAYLLSTRRGTHLSGAMARLGIGNINLEHELAKDSRIAIVYDGDCPLCSTYVTMTRLQKAVGTPTLLKRARASRSRQGPDGAGR